MFSYAGDEEAVMATIHSLVKGKCVCKFPVYRAALEEWLAKLCKLEWHAQYSITPGLCVF